MSNDPEKLSRRGALKCLGFGGAGTLFALSGGVFTPIDLASAGAYGGGGGTGGAAVPLFVQTELASPGFADIPSMPRWLPEVLRQQRAARGARPALPQAGVVWRPTHTAVSPPPTALAGL